MQENQQILTNMIKTLLRKEADTLFFFFLLFMMTVQNCLFGFGGVFFLHHATKAYILIQ